MQTRKDQNAGTSKRAGKIVPKLPNAEYSPREYKLIALRECPIPEKMVHLTSPREAVAYWKAHIAPGLNPDVETLAVIVLNAQRRIKGHQIVAIGDEDAVTFSQREVFRAAVILGAASVIVIHNHPSGLAEPSNDDLAMCALFDKAGEILHVEHLDSIIVGDGQFASLKGFGDGQPGKAQSESPAALAILPGSEPFKALPLGDPDEHEHEHEEAWEGWDRIIAFNGAPHPDLWVGPDDRFYLAGGSEKLVQLSAKQVMTYFNFAQSCHAASDITLNRIMGLIEAALPGEPVHYLELLKLAEAV